jgi:hypothetical protein
VEYDASGMQVRHLKAFPASFDMGWTAEIDPTLTSDLQGPPDLIRQGRPFRLGTL